MKVIDEIVYIEKLSTTKLDIKLDLDLLFMLIIISMLLIISDRTVGQPEVRHLILIHQLFY